jgi:hypothetical protein
VDSQVVNRALSRLGSSVKQADDVGVEMLAYSIEQPAVRVDLLGILLLKAEDHLNGDEVVGAARDGEEDQLF